MAEQLLALARSLEALGLAGLCLLALAFALGSLTYMPRFAFYSISLGGRVSNSGGATIKAIAGPRVAHGTGRFTHVSARGTWNGTGPSGRCSGYWTASRS